MWWVAAGSQVFVTEDGGRSWTRLAAAIPPGMYVAGLSAFDSRLAWAIATDTQLIGLVSAHPTVLPAPPRLFLTTDGGRSWSELQVPDTTGPRS